MGTSGLFRLPRDRGTPRSVRMDRVILTGPRLVIVAGNPFLLLPTNQPG